MNIRNTNRRLAALALSILLVGVIGYFTFNAEAANPDPGGQQGQAGRGTAVQQERPSVQQPTENLPELRVGQTFEPGQVPKCPNQPVEYLGGVVDNFGGGPDPYVWSPQLATFLSGKPVRKFDEGGANKLLGQSFRIGSCKVCAVQLEAKIKNEGDISPYDKIYIYGKDIIGTDLIWSATIPLGTTNFSAYLPLPSITKLNQHIFTNAPGHWLNVIEQDDYQFDYVKVRVWYY